MVPSPGVYLPIPKLYSILPVANLLAHNNISQICYCSQISLQSAAVNCSFSDNLTHSGGKIYFAVDGTIRDGGPIDHLAVSQGQIFKRVSN